MTAFRDGKSRFFNDPRNRRGAPPVSTAVEARHTLAEAPQFRVDPHAGISRTPGYAALYRKIVERIKS